jgi:hypothetical protein
MRLDTKWRWLVYVLVGICLVVAVTAVSLRFPRWKPTATENNLTSALLGTIVLLGYVLRWGWQYRRLPKFWLTFSALALAHCAAFVSLSFYVERWPILLLGTTIGVEAIAMAMVILWAMDGTRA